MILIFDLDDTLYEERSYVDSGLRAVAQFGAEEFGWDAGISFAFMTQVLETEGRGRIFDLWLEYYGRKTAGLVKECVRIYRHHLPNIRLSTETEHILSKLVQVAPLYVVTDGHKVAQSRKVEALRLDRYVQKSYITHRYGVRNAKPSVHCFDLIRRRERRDWQDMLYVGDNPRKDFVNIRKCGMTTVRVLTGCYRDLVVPEEYDADFSIENLGALLPLLWDRRLVP
ncbi:HAD family hydrolase [Paracoccus denitrificans]|uniref:HAD family hydrolase n=1 Tax=Paracoccus denitrificans TaxID=266 RepID=UPI003364D3B9